MSMDITKLLHCWQKGDQKALEQLLPIVSKELHSLAIHYMNKEKNGHTLQATALVNEAYIRLANIEIDLKDRNHFLALASKLMRNVLVDHARSKTAKKREHEKIENENLENQPSGTTSAEELLLAHKLMDKLAEMDERACRILEMSTFGGIPQEAIAQVESISVSTVTRELRAAKAWIQSQLLDS